MLTARDITLDWGDGADTATLDLLARHGAAIVRNYRSELDDHTAQFDRLFDLARDRGDAAALDPVHRKNLGGGLSATGSGAHLKLDGPASLRAIAPDIADAFADPFVVRITRGYLGEDATVARHIILTDDAGPADAILPFHFDEIRSLKFFLYLTDPSDQGGAFEFLSGTAPASRHVRELEWNRVDDYARIVNRVIDQRSNGWLYTFYGAVGPVLLLDTVACVAPAGSLVVFDTDVLHRGGALAEGRRRKVARASSYAGVFG